MPYYFRCTVFTESPKSVTSLPGRDVLFHCAGYQTDVPAERLHLTWIIDNQPFDQIIAAASPGITQNTVPSGNTIQSNLTIPATPGNNGTTVRCHIGEFLDEPVISNSSILTVLLGDSDNFNIHQLHTPMNFSVSWVVFSSAVQPMNLLPRPIACHVSGNFSVLKFMFLATRIHCEN